MQQPSPLVNADSWTQNVILSHLSGISVDEAVAAADAMQDAMRQPHACQPLLKQLQAAPAAKANSTDSTSTAHRGSGTVHEAQPAGSQQQSFLGPMRQTSLDMLAAMEARAMQPVLERQNLFQDVLEQLAQREELPPTGIFPMPSVQFLESLLDDIGAQGPAGSCGAPVPVDLPLNLPADAFDLDFKPTPFDQAAQQPVTLQRGGITSVHGMHGAGLVQQPMQQRIVSTAHAGYMQQQQQQQLLPPGMVPAMASTAAQAQYAYVPRTGVAAHRPTAASMPLPDMHHGMSSGVSVARRAASARRVHSMYEDMNYEPEVSIQTSKSGRVRKVASFTGTKRKSMGDGATAVSALPRHMITEMNTTSESHDSWRSGEESGSEVSKGSKGGGRRGKKGKRTTCLNCGCHQTPQWRCGPLGPRTLCNACGVRYKKGLPLNCWPLRDGMMLPAGAELPPDIRAQIPAHWTINYMQAPVESS